MAAMAAIFMQKMCKVSAKKQVYLFFLRALSHQLHILRSDLTYYFEQHLQRTFRVWLSDIRFQEVQRMMIQYPDYNNDAISSECGFSSRAHLYRIFKQKTGMTPGEWKASGSYQALGDTDTR